MPPKPIYKVEVNHDYPKGSIMIEGVTYGLTKKFYALRNGKVYESGEMDRGWKEVMPYRPR